MHMVEADEAAVDKKLRAGEYPCPACEGELRPWGLARRRSLRAEDSRSVSFRPRRARCKACLLTHVLLPVLCLLRRCDLAEMIGRGLALKVAGWGYRRLAAALAAGLTEVPSIVRELDDREALEIALVENCQRAGT